MESKGLSVVFKRLGGETKANLKFEIQDQNAIRGKSKKGSTLTRLNLHANSIFQKLIMVTPF